MGGSSAPYCQIISVVISGTGDKHYFPSCSLIMSVLPHGWLSMAVPEPLAPTEGLGVHSEIYHVCFFRSLWVSVQSGQMMNYRLALSGSSPLFSSFYLCSLLHVLAFFKSPFLVGKVSVLIDFIFLTYLHRWLFVFKCTEEVFVERLWAMKVYVRCECKAETK